MALALGDRDQFQAAAPEIGDHALRTWEGADRAHRGGLGLFLARELPDSEPEFGNPGEKLRAIGGIAGGGGGDGLDIVDRIVLDQQREARQRPQRLRGGLLGDRPGGGEIAAEPRGDLLVPHHPRRARRAFVDHQAHGVGADIDHRAGRVDDPSLAAGFSGFAHALS